MARTCVALYSGGLDSMIAVRLMAEQAIRVVALHTRNCFHGAGDWDAKVAALEARLPALGAERLVVRDLTDAVVELTKRPRYGHGKNVNACLDCRLRTLYEAKLLADEIGADFLVTGEVLGQRPMSQRKDAMRTVDRHVRDWGIAGRLLRPLSARVLEPTLPETEGWVDRDRLGDISGRGRHGQFALAARLGIADFPSPAGGCLLTDPGYAGRLRDLMDHGADWNADDAELLKRGRHYRLDPFTKIVVGREHADNEAIRQWAADRAARRPEAVPPRLYAAADHPGAVVLVDGPATPEAERLAAGLALHHSKARASGRGAVWAWEAGRPDSRRRLDDQPVLEPAATEPRRIQPLAARRRNR